MGFRIIGKKRVMQEISEEFCDVCGRTVEPDSMGDKVWISVEEDFGESTSYSICSHTCMCMLAAHIFEGEEIWGFGISARLPNSPKETK